MELLALDVIARRVVETFGTERSCAGSERFTRGAFGAGQGECSSRPVAFSAEVILAGGSSCKDAGRMLTEHSR